MTSISQNDLDVIDELDVIDRWSRRVQHPFLLDGGRAGMVV
jgi:hypothetical protein